MNSTLTSNVNEDDSIDQLAVVGSRLSLLSENNVEFLQSENKRYATSTESNKGLKPLVLTSDVNGSQQKLMTCVDRNKNTYSNSHITLIGSKEKPLVNGNKEKIVLNGCKEKITEDSIPVPKISLYSGKIHVDWKHVHKIGAGLNNLGNTCFMNTVIQCLTYCPPLANYLLHDNDHQSKCHIPTTGFCMMCILQRHMKQAIGKSGDIIKPNDVYHRLKLIAKHFQFGRQEDAHEFLRYVIDNLWKSCLSQNNSYSKLDSASKETTVINQIFGGYHRSQVICLRCKGKSNTFDHFMDFILDIKQNVLSLEKALDKFIQPELLEQENSYKCPKCKMKVTAQKRFTVYRAPNVATFQFKRFDYNRSFGGKITKQITYPEKLNLRPYMSESKGDPVWYRLNAVLVHSGPTCNSGHYYCYVKNSNGYWYIMDDQRVHQVSLPQVLNQSAYVLFYIKVASTEGSSVKKSFENGNSFMKTNFSSCNYKKISDVTSIKSLPLTENNQPRQSSPKPKQHVYPTINLNKRNGLSPNVNKESFGIRSTTSSTSQDMSKLANSTCSPAKKVKSLQNASQTHNYHSCLVPYNEDSSGSSDENDNQRTISKASFQSSNSCISKSESVKSSFVSNSFPNFNKKRKAAKTLFQPKSSNPSINLSSYTNSSTSPKMITSGLWTVTDAASPSADSNSSLNSVHSTTDWHVTNTHSDTLAVPQMPDVSHSVSLGDQKMTHAIECEPSNNVDSNKSLSLWEKCEHPEPETKCEETISVESSNKPQQSSFLKRKCSDLDQEFLDDSKFHVSESQYSPVPKKVKHAAETVKSCDQTKPSSFLNGTESLNSNQTNVSSHEISELSVRTPVKPSFLDLGNTLNVKRKKLNGENKSSRCSSNSSLEYEWVEKTKESNEGASLSSKDDNFVKEDRNHFGNSNHDRKAYQKLNVVKELTKDSNSIYARKIPTWHGNRDNKLPIYSNSAKQKNFNDYEEYDRGKSRKFRPKDFNQYCRKQNPFQKYAERNNGYNKHEDRHYYRRRYDKPYSSHHRWKQNSHHNFPKHFKANFHR